MTSRHQMWLTYDNEREKLQFPFLPSSLSIKMGTKHQSVDIAGLGEIFVRQGRPAISISFSSFFPEQPFFGVQVPYLTNPDTLVSMIERWKNGDKAAHFIITNSPINMYCLISDFPVTLEGGDIGAAHYSLTLKEDRDVTVRQVSVNVDTHVATVSDTPMRADNRVTPSLYVVVKGDCLYHIAKRLLGDGGRWNEIYNLNRDVIKNANLIYPGQTLRIPS